MLHSSKHKSSKHGTREHSDSERISGRKGQGDSADADAAPAKASRDSDKHGSSKRRKDRGGNGGGGGGGRERWNGGEDERGEGSRKASKARPRDEKERKAREGRSERSVDNEELRASKRGYENNDSRTLDEFQSPELDNQLQRQIRKKREYSDGDKHQVDVGDVYDRQVTSRGEIAKDTSQKEHRRKDGKYGDKYREEMDREDKHRHDKQQDDNPPKDHTIIKSDDKHGTEEKESLESREKRIKLSESDCGQECKHEQYNDHVHDCNYDKDQDRYQDQDRDPDRDWDRDHDHDCGHHHDLDDRSATSKDSKTKKRTLDEYGGCSAPRGLMERSPSTTSERRYLNRSDVRQSLEIEESGRRNIIGARDFSSSDNRQGRELTLEKPLLDEPPQAASSLYGGTSQGNVSLIRPPPAFQAALGGPFMGSVEDDVRNNSSARYRRSIDPGFRRGHGNSWRAVPNWTSPVPNGFVSFQPGPAHGGFQSMLPQFAAQPLFGVRPSMEVNHAGISYHIADADRFPGHLRPIGWQDVMNGTAPAHLRGWESNNGVFRDDPHMDDGSDWYRNRHLTNIRGWESGRETWKERNGASKKDFPFPACKDESVPAQEDDILTDHAIKVSRDDEHEKDDFHEKSSETKKSSSLSSPEKVPLNSSSTTVLHKAPDSLTPSDNTYLFSRFYLSKLDISADLIIPELYNQCMCVVNVGSIGSVDADSTANLFQKNGSRVPKKYAATFSSHLPFPAIDNSIFQRAIGLYRKQRVELPNGGKVHISAHHQVLVDESAPIRSLENQHVSASVFDGKEDVPMSLLEQKKLETLSPGKQNLEEIDQASCQMVQDHDKKREPVAGLCEKEDEDTSEKEDLGDAEENNLMAFKDESQLAPALHKDGDNRHSKTVTNDFAHCADEKLGFGDNIIPVISGDGSPRSCDALMPGSNEYESLILSRIHHSSESTP